MKKDGLINILVTIALIFVLTLVLQGPFARKQAKAEEEAAKTVAVFEEAKQEVVSYKPVNKGEKATTFDYETDLFKITFDTKGASVKAITLKNHANADGEYVDMVFKGENDHNAFLMYWGDDLDHPVTDAYAFEKKGDKVIFRKTYEKENGKQFTVEKTYEFKNGEYLFNVSVDMTGDVPCEDTYAYTLAYEPQVGPEFKSLKKNSNYDYRRFYVGLFKGDNGKVKRSSVKLSNNAFYTTRNIKWMSLTSKYFTVIAYPENKATIYRYAAMQGTGEVSQTNGMYISVPSEAVEDSGSFYFYCGPQLKQYLKSYYNGFDNAWGVKGFNLDDAMESGSALGWLENILKWCLTVLHKVIPNYGLTIVVLTIILKLVMWPLQKKGMASTAKMNTLTPEINKIKEKYANNPQKQNELMQALYRDNGVKPLGGCLPMLIQFPILIAFYGLLNKHFELRGAMFIPGWIPDLSVPDVVGSFGFNFPLLGSEIHLLPIIYTVSMILSMKITQSKQGTQQQQGMWMMTWGMPIMFFFILYSAPSGLLLYWTVSNILAIAEQLFINTKLDKGTLNKKKEAPQVSQKKEPAAVLKYQEKMKKLQDANKKDNK